MKYGGETIGEFALDSGLTKVGAYYVSKHLADRKEELVLGILFPSGVSRHAVNRVQLHNHQNAIFEINTPN